MIKRTMLQVVCALGAAMFVGGCASRNEPAKGGRDVEAEAGVAIHERIDQSVRLVRRGAVRMDDGRLKVQVVLANRRSTDLGVTAFTQFYGKRGEILERSTQQSFTIPTGGTALFEDVSFDTRAAGYSVAVRPAWTKYR